MSTGLGWLPKYTIGKYSSVSALCWLSHQHLAVCENGWGIDVHQVTHTHSHLTYKLTTKKNWYRYRTSVAVSESTPKSMLVVRSGKPYVYQYPCQEASKWEKKYKISGDSVDPTYIVANANTAVVMSDGCKTLNTCSLPDFKKQSQVHLNFIPQVLSISTDYLLVMGEDEMVVKPLGNLRQDLCRIEPPNRGIFFRCVSFTNNAREIFVGCAQGEWTNSSRAVYKYIRSYSGNNTLYSNAGIVVPWAPILPPAWLKSLVVSSDGSLLAIGICEAGEFKIILYSFESV